MYGKKYNNFLEFKKTFFHKIHRMLLYRSHQVLLFHYAFDAVLLVIVVFSIFQIVQATTPNPGHPWSELGDGVFIFTNSQTVTPYTYTFPAASATVLTTNAAVTIAQGGLGGTTALQSARRDATNTTYEAFTPGDMLLAGVQTVTGAKTFNDTKFLLNNVAGTFTGQFTNTNTGNRTYTLKDSNGTLAFTSDIPSVGTWGLLNYPTWTTGTPFVKMTAAGTFALDTNTYGVGDMVLASAQTVTGAKTFNDTKLLMRNVANTFNGSFTNTNTADRVYTLKDSNGTLAFTSDIPSISGFVPYTGATGGVNLGAYSLTTPNIIGGSTTTSPLTFQTTTGIGTTGADMHFKVGNNGATEALTILNNGNVGMGITNPGSKLNISYTSEASVPTLGTNGGALSLLGTSSAYGLVGGVLSSGNVYLQSQRVDSTATAYAMLLQPNGGNVGIGTSSATQALSFDGIAAHTIWMERNTTAATAGQGLTLSSGGAIAGTADLAGGDLNLKSGIATGTGSSTLRFFTATPQGSTNTTDNAPTEKMTILGNGNVGIGTTSPTYKLDVSGSDNQLLASSFTSTDQAAGTDLFYDFRLTGNDSVTNTAGEFKLGKEQLWTSTASTRTSYFAFKTRNNNVLTEAMRISGNGNVGIGTTGPVTKLQIDKRIQTSGDTVPSGALLITDTGGSNFGMEAGVSVANSYGWLQARNITSATMYNLALNPNGGNVGIGTTTPTALLHLKAGSDVTNGAPLKLTSGTLTTGANISAGAIEWDGTNLYATQTSGPTRKTIAYTDSAISSSLYLGTTLVALNRGSGALSLAGVSIDGTANIAGGTVGAVPYQTGANATGVVAATATANKMFLSGASAIPTWSTSTIPTSAGATANKVLLSDGTNYVLSTPTFPNASATAGKLIVSDGTNWIASTPTYPNSSATSRKILVSDGTNFTASTETWAVPGTSGNILRSDGTNWTSVATPTWNQDTTGSAGSLKSTSTTGLMTVTGMGAGTTRLKTVSDANDTLLELAGSYTPTGIWTSLHLNEAVDLTTTSTKLNYLTSATGTTGTTSTNLVFSTSPTLVTPTLGVAGATSLAATGVLSSGTNGGTGGQLTLNGSTSGSGVLKVAAAAGAGIVFQLPSSNGSNTNVLQTDGAGVTSWVAAPAGGGRLDQISAANTTATIDSLTNAIAWNWSTATTQNPFSMSANGLSTGSLLSLSTNGTAAGASQKLLNLSSSGTNATGGITTYGAYISNTHAGATSTNVGLYATASGGTTANYAAIFDQGNVGIGTTAPTQALSFDGIAAHTIWMERNTTAATAGQGLTLSSGGAIAGTNNLAGGDLSLKSGISTGTGTSDIHFFTATAGSSGATDNNPTEKMAILGSGKVLIGATSDPNSSTSKLYISGSTSSNGSSSAIAGVLGDYTFTNGGNAGYVQVGNRFVVTNSPTTNSNTAVGELVRMIDSSGLSNTVRGLDITSNGGTNTSGTNTGLRATGSTFGVQGVTSAVAGSVAAPAALYGESTGTTQGDVLRLYSNTMTSATSFATFYHTSSTFTGTGLLMDFAAGSGTFSGDFINLKKGGASFFKVTNAGIVSMHLPDNANVATAALCSTVGPGNNPAAGTSYELRDCSGAPVADYAEMYPVEKGIEYGDIVAIGTEMVPTYDTDKNGEIDWTKVKGNISKLVKSQDAYQKTVIGIVSNNKNDFSSTGYNIKEGDNPMPVALNGRVPVKISPSSSPIKTGDYITTSMDSGMATRALKSGFVIGKALEDWSPSSGQMTIMIYIEQGYYESDSAHEFANETTFNGLTFFNANVEFAKSVKFSDAVEFTVPPLWNSDTAGFAVIKRGSDRVDVVFNRAYIATPVVNTTIAFDKIKNQNGENISFDSKSFFNDDIKSLVIDKDENGFAITINKPAPQDLRFSWIALSVKDPKVFESVITGLVIESTFPVVTPLTNLVDVPVETQTASVVPPVETTTPPVTENQPVVEPTPPPVEVTSPPVVETTPPAADTPPPQI